MSSLKLKNKKFALGSDIKQMTALANESLLEALLRHKVPISWTCGGNGSCTTCRVVVLQADFVSLPTPVEIEITTDRGFESNERLSCQIEDWENLIVEVPKKS